MAFPHSLTGPMRGRRRLVPVVATAGCLLATAASASADTRVAIEPGKFGSGIEGGAVLTARDQRDLFHDERIRVTVTQLSSGRWQVTDAEREVVAGPNCRRSSPSVAICEPRNLDGIFMSGTKFGDVLNNDTAVASRIEGGDGNDRLDGGDGNDTMIGEVGDDTLSGRLGVGDTAVYSGGPVVVTLDNLANDGGSAEDDNVLADTENVIGTASSDVIVGSESANVITGGGGDDRIDGNGGDDTLRDGGSPSGADDLNGGLGKDTVTYLGRTTGVTVRLNGVADDGNDIDDAGPSGSREDNVRNVEIVNGTDRTDFIQGDAGPNTIDGNGGVDSVQGLGGDDTIIGDRDRDSLEGGEGNDTLDGDVVNGTDIAADALRGGPGDDVLQAREGDDRLSGDEGNDRLEGGGGDDTFDGGLGADSQQGDAGFDLVDYNDRRTPVFITLGEGSGDDGNELDGPQGRRDTLRFIEYVITGDADDVIVGGVVAERFDPRGGRDLVEAGGGGDTLKMNDGIADAISCGQDNLPLEPVDTLEADLADILDPANQQRLPECESIQAAPVGELPNVRILTERLRIAPRRRARIRVHCPAAVTTKGCAGRLTLTHPGDGKPLAARRYRLAKGKRATLSLQLTRTDVRWLKRSKRALATAVETGPSGRPKTTRMTIAVVGRRR
jgi:Ca2+-binding RTX toxin-like protein